MPTIQTNGIETYYERRGEGPPIVFVHAAMLDHTMWGPQIERFTDKYETIVYDLRGHGRTGGSEVPSYSADLWVKDLHALIEGLGLERPVVCGHSLGGMVVQVYATKYPEGLSGVVLADTFVPERLHWSERLNAFVLWSTILPVRLLGLARIQRAMVRVTTLFDDEAEAGDYATVERIQAEMPPIPADEFAKIVRTILAFYQKGEGDYPSIRVPTLVMYGENTMGLGRRHCEKLAREIPGASLRVVPGGGHASNLDDPEFYSDAMAELLKRVDFVRGDAPDDSTPEQATPDGGDEH
ncbi:alpha/beta fold hydrolase [Haladaptatus sp. NG-SE-30]